MPTNEHGASGSALARVGIVARRRVAQMVPALIGLTIVTFLLVRLLPGGPAQALAGVRATPEITREVNNRLGLDDPLPVQYVTYVGRLLHGDLGTSFISGSSVGTIISTHLGLTLLLVAYAVLIAVVLGVPLAVVAALRMGRLPDHLIRLAVVVSFALPSFWIGVLLIAFFGLRLEWFPSGGAGEGFVGHVYHLFLPAATLAATFLAVLVRSLRSRLLELLHADFVDAARLKGINGTRILVVHVLRIAIVPFIALVGMNVSYLLGASVVVENVYAVDGIGQQLIAAVLQRDFLLVQGIVLIFGVVVVLVGLVTELLQAYLDPRILEGRDV